MRKLRSDFDNAWKEVLERYFASFMAFFFPSAHREIDWSRGVEFLEKELRQAVRSGGRGKRAVDKLVKAWRKDGKEAWVLVHVEVQSQVEPEFPQRIYIYNTFLFGRHKRCVVSLAILGDTDASWRPRSFESGLWGCRALLEFPVVKLLDYESRLEELASSENPFAIVVIAHLKTQATHHDFENRFQWKVRILRWLYREGRSEEEFADLFRFLDLVMLLPADLEAQFEKEIEQYEEVRKMEWLSNYERRAMQRGMQRGMQQGIQQGAVQTAREAALEVLSLRFQAVPRSLSERIHQLEDLSVLKELHRKAITVSSLHEFEEDLSG
ncbi:transposase [Candidatus Poribacteria bacterium]|nr:transposase [Candidatus Poribacteria bacterium]